MILFLSNDYNYILSDPKKRNDEFIQEYIYFIGMVKECNLNLLIIYTVSSIGNNEIYKLFEKAVKLFGNEKVISFELPPQYAEDGNGYLIGIHQWHHKKDFLK